MDSRRRRYAQVPCRHLRDNAPRIRCIRAEERELEREPCISRGPLHGIQVFVVRLESGTENPLCEVDRGGVRLDRPGRAPGFTSAPCCLVAWQTQ